ncbi:MAG: hypothetical protein NTZ69_14990 [Bacteroidia bacterium]|nr:hypothetical protein [Bacteroidia bacterium]
MINIINTIKRLTSGFGQKIIGVFLLVLLSFGVFSQEGPGLNVNYAHSDSTLKGKLLVEINNLNFFKDNEFKSKYIDGYTLTGMWIRPKVLYYPDNKFRLELGGQVLAYNGREDYKLFPWFSAVYMPTKNITFRMGNLDQDQNHGLAEPVMDSEHLYKDKPEAGIQLKINRNRWIADFWIDWQKMIFKGDPYKERFVFGTAGRITLFQTEKRKLSMPIVFNGLHEGGEIDAATGLAQTHIVVSEGLKYEYETGGSLVKSGRLECSFLQSTYPQSETALPGRSGIGFFVQAALNTDYGTFASGYWQGNRFFTPLGMPLYQNGATGQVAAVDVNRLLVLSYRFERKIFNQSSFGFVSDNFYNPTTRKISNAAALFLSVNLSILCSKKAL